MSRNKKIKHKDAAERAYGVNDKYIQFRRRPKRRKANFRRLIIAIFLMAAQLALIIWALVAMNAFALSSYIIFQIAGVIAEMRIVLNQKNPSYKIAWLTAIMFVPVLGIIFYEMWGRGRNPKRVKKRVPAISEMAAPLYGTDSICAESFAAVHPEQSRIMQYLLKAGFPVYGETDVKYFELADKLFPDLIEELKNAEKFIFLEFFILSEGALWQEVFSILKDKAARGVDVRVLYDDFGCITCLPEGFEADMKKAGIKTAAFNKIKPIVNNFYMNYRNHQKICVVDGNTGYTGGMNLADEYVNTVDAFGHWKDSGIKLSGKGVWSLTVMFLQMWEYATYRKKSPNYNQNCDIFRPDADFCKAHNKAAGFVQPFSDGPLSTPNETEAEYLYMQIINSAKKYVYITTPYLVPDNEMITALRLAALSGVDVRIITPGIPDKKYVYLVTNSFYGILMSAGVRIYEYEPGFIHAKNLVCDGESAVVGTVNMDFRSFYLHFENGVWMCGGSTPGKIEEDFTNTLKYCREIKPEEWEKRPLKMKFTQAILKLIAPLL